MRPAATALALLVLTAAGPAPAAEGTGASLCRSLDNYLGQVHRDRRRNVLSVRYSDSWVACGYKKNFRPIAQPICTTITGWGFDSPPLFPQHVRDCLIARGARVTMDETGQPWTASHRVDRLDAQVPGFGLVAIVFEPDVKTGYNGYYGTYVMTMTPVRDTPKR